MKKMLYGSMLVCVAALVAACSSDTTAPTTVRSSKLAPRPFADVVTWTGNGTTEGVCNRIADFGDLEPEPGQQGWLFILNSPGTGPHELTYEFDDGTAGSVGPSKEVGSIHFVVYTASGAKLVSASAVNGTSSSILTVSHCEDGGGGGAKGSETVTEVHDADHEEVDNANPAALGSTVHDQATVTTTDNVEIPEGSYVTFYFWNNNTCDGTPAYTSNQMPLSGTSPGVVDDGLPQGPLGAGEYSYQANFTSGDPTKVIDGEGACEPFKVAKGTLHITTNVHNASHEDITNGNTPLGSVVHDVATVTGAVEGFDPENSVSFTFFTNNTCYGTGTGVAANGADGSGTKSVDSDPLAAGSYSYLASLEGDDNYTVIDDTGCEPFTVDKASTTISTTPHDASHTSILNGSVPAGSYVHDVATVGTKVGDFAITGTVTFKLYANSSCTGDPIASATETVGLGNDATDGTRSSDFLLTVVGAFGYSAKYNGNDNYLASSDGDCEPFAGAAPGKTQGFWGNKNGQARLVDEDAFSLANRVTIGENVATRCGVVVSSAAISLAILPSTLNGLSLIPQCDATGERDSGINGNSLNNLLSQTLALSYNIKYITNYSGFTISALGCTAVSPLTSASTVAAVRDYANSLIANAIKNNGSSTVTQSQIGAMNTLLGCLNREA